MSTSIAAWTLEEIRAAVSGTIVAGDPCAVIRGLTTDSRSVPPRSLFVALKGERHDAHAFLPSVAAQGAAAAIVDRAVPAPAGFAQVLVEDTTRALGDLARAHRRRTNAITCAVTGSSGKTSTKNFLAAICRRRHRTLATTGNLNNHIGVPLTLFQLEPRTERAVVEMGMSGRGEIARLAEIAEPSVGVITGVAPCHLEQLGSLEGVIEAKSELSAFLNERDGVVVLPADHPQFRELAKRVSCRLVTAGESPEATVRIGGIQADGYAPASFVYRGVRITLRLPGRHMVVNAALAAAAAECLAIDPLDIVEGLSSVFPAAGRASAHRVDGVLIVDDAYNSNPSSLAAGIRMLAGEPANRRILVMADMLELGAESPRYHEEIGALVAECGLDILVHRGAMAAHAAAAAKGVRRVACSSNAEMVEELSRLLLPGDAVLVKASHGMKLDEVVQALLLRRGRAADVVALRR